MPRFYTPSKGVRARGNRLIPTTQGDTVNSVEIPTGKKDGDRSDHWAPFRRGHGQCVGSALADKVGPSTGLPANHTHGKLGPWPPPRRPTSFPQQSLCGRPRVYQQL
jgi:hypothetical protein